MAFVSSHFSSVPKAKSSRLARWFARKKVDNPLNTVTTHATPQNIGVGLKRQSVHHVQFSDPFNPSAPVYKMCCAHVRTTTIVFGIIEIFAICFVLVAVLPDLNMCKGTDDLNRTSHLVGNSDANGRIPDNGPPNVEKMTPDKLEKQRTLDWLKKMACDLNVLWLVWAIVQILAVNIMFYGIKNNYWQLFIPHLVFRTICIILMIFLSIVLFITVSLLQNTTAAYVISAIACAIAIVTWIYLIIGEARCAHFVKRSKETGYSLSQARPVGPPTTSLSDHANQRGGLRQVTQPMPPVRELPPLKHTYGAPRQMDVQTQRADGKRPGSKD